MSQSESFRPLSELEAPDFERPPVGTQGLYALRSASPGGRRYLFSTRRSTERP